MDIVRQEFFPSLCSVIISFAIPVISSFAVSPFRGLSRGGLRVGRKRLLRRSRKVEVFFFAFDAPRYFLIRVLLGLLLCGAGPLCAQSDESSHDRIHPGDLIEVDELGGFDYDWRGRLDTEGFLDGLSRVADPVFARCKSPAELGEILRVTYSKTLRDPRVVVRILDRSQRPFAILDGAVRRPLRLQIRRNVRISELAVIAGGFTDRASGEISIVRPPYQSCANAGNSADVISIKVSDILSGAPEADALVFPGDIVTIRMVEPVYVIGGVNRPGRVDWRDGATVSRVVAAAGGVSGRGVSGRVSIFRKEATLNRVIDVDLDKILSGAAEDVVVGPRDIIDVPLKGRPRSTGPPELDVVEPVADRSVLPIRVID